MFWMNFTLNYKNVFGLVMDLWYILFRNNKNILFVDNGLVTDVAKWGYWRDNEHLNFNQDLLKYFKAQSKFACFYIIVLD